jgi:hypothetical protein
VVGHVNERKARTDGTKHVRMHPRVKISLFERRPITSSSDKRSPQAFEFGQDERQYRLTIEPFSRTAEQRKRCHRRRRAHVDSAPFSEREMKKKIFRNSNLSVF